ncbi:MAG: hypothetical protein PHV68_07905 [Candidatus Gastranaerophilales bacterium]|nr:hypothetical protein [Candidatus Gastranaerophilales bacterium]
MAKKWIPCIACIYLQKCNAGQAKTQNITSKVSEDIGCFDCEQYKKQIADKQLKLF